MRSTTATGTEHTMVGTAPPSCRPKLSVHVRLSEDRTRGQHVLLSPESVTVLNPTAAAIVALCDGRRTFTEVVWALRDRYDRVHEDEVRDFLERLAARGYLECGDA